MVRSEAKSKLGAKTPGGLEGPERLAERQTRKIKKGAISASFYFTNITGVGYRVPVLVGCVRCGQAVLHSRLSHAKIIIFIEFCLTRLSIWSHRK